MPYALKPYRIIDSTTGQTVYAVDAISTVSAVLRFRRRMPTEHHYPHVVAVLEHRIPETHVGGLHKGDTVTFATAERSVTGLVTALRPPNYQGDYAEVYMTVDGMNYCFGTGGHLGKTWTTEGGMDQWFMDRLVPKVC